LGLHNKSFGRERNLLTQGDAELAQIIFRLLRNATSQQVVRDFLKSLGIATSAQNWDDLFTRRIQPALNEGLLTISDFRSLLQQVEECGRQHTFLFKCDADSAHTLLSRARVTRIASEEGLGDLLTDPLDLELPDEPTIVDIRLTPHDGARHLSELMIKVVETRTTKVFVGETWDRVAGTMTKQYVLHHKRAVNVAVLRDTGVLELRIASQDNQSKYHDNLRVFRAAIARFIPQNGFAAVLLSRAKTKLWNDQESLAGEIRYSHSSARNDFGFVMNVSSSSQADNISTDDGSKAAMQSFLDSEGHVTAANVYVKIPDTDREIHLLLSGEPNEFAIPVACSAEDYAYVRDKILSFNRASSARS